MIDDKVISIIIPVYNTKKVYIDRCLRPFIECNECSHFEVIVVDDGSDEDVAAYLDDIAANCDVVSVLHQSNQGQNAARSNGVRHSHGKFIQFLDSDDWIVWDAEMELACKLEQLSPDVDIVALHAVRVNDDGEKIADYTSVLPSYDNHTVLASCSVLWSQVYRSSFIKGHDFTFVSDIHIGEDLATIVPIISNSKSIVYFGKPLYMYVEHDGSVSHNKNNIQYNFDIVKAFEHILQSQDIDYKKYKDEIEWLAIWHIAYLGFNRILSTEGVNVPKLHALRNYLFDTFPDWKNNPYYTSKHISRGVRAFFFDNNLFRLYSFIRLFIHG